MLQDQNDQKRGSGKPVQPVTADAPYPPVKAGAENPQYARMLSLDLAASRSEMTSITQYLYQSWALSAEHMEVAETMRRIAVVEMHHLDMMGKLITQLGGTPRYAAMQRQPMAWNGNMVNYSRSLEMVMRNNMALEQSAIDTYRKQAAVIQDEHIVVILRRIIMDEEVHMRIFRRYLDTAR